MSSPARTSGFSLNEVLISAAILSALVLGGLIVTDTATRTASNSHTERSLTQDARSALNAIKDDLRSASREGSVTDPEATTTTLRGDPDRPGSITIHLEPTASPQNAITYYLDAGTLYRSYRTTLTPLALNAHSINAAVENDLITITITLQHGDTQRQHEASVRFRNP